MSQQSDSDPNLIIATSYGSIKGFIKEAMRRFLGIPYAARPVADRRWRPPEPPSPWHEPENATTFGHVPAQHAPCFPGFSHTSYTEDCLYLNVFTPVRRKSDLALPVIVLIPGGGLFCGCSHDYDPTDMVTIGNIVFVSIDYRLGIFGFFSHPAINAEPHPIGNYGLMDQQFALQWVQSNIKHFGGDPDNVTIMGESAGGVSVMVHVGSPGSNGLFHKAIVQSGGSPPTVKVDTTRAAEQKGIDLAATAGCKDQTSSSLRQIPAVNLIRANTEPPGTFGAGLFTIGLTEDGVIVPFSFRHKFSSGDFNKVPLLIGSNRDEFSWFLAMVELATGSVIASEDYPKALAATLHEASQLRIMGVRAGPESMEEILSRYLLNLHLGAGRTIAAAVGDAGAISTHTRRIARTLKKSINDVYVYEFDVPDSPVAWPKVSFPYGSAHTQELQYLFPQFHGADGTVHLLSKSQQLLAKAMVAFWTAFAKSGNPNASTATPDQNPKWVEYNTEDDNVMLLSTSKLAMLSDCGASSGLWSKK